VAGDVAEAIGFEPPQTVVNPEPELNADLISVRFDAAEMLLPANPAEEGSLASLAVIEVIRRRPETFFGLKQVLVLLADLRWRERLLVNRVLVSCSTTVLTRHLRGVLKSRGDMRSFQSAVEEFVLRSL
jgi:hypothetical protein